MQIHIHIDELVLNGFNYHDYRRIGAALEHELARMIKESGLPGVYSQHYELPKMEVGSFNIPRDMNPRVIGADIAKSVGIGLKRLQNSKPHTRVGQIQ